jgi:hypothetical protein
MLDVGLVWADGDPLAPDVIAYPDAGVSPALAAVPASTFGLSVDHTVVAAADADRGGAWR